MVEPDVPGVPGSDAGIGVPGFNLVFGVPGISFLESVARMASIFNDWPANINGTVLTSVLPTSHT